VRPTEPTSALIAMALDRDGRNPFVCQTLYEYNVKRGCWISLGSYQPLNFDVFMWLSEESILPEDLFQRVTP
jgi:hypothetical protein